jgi:RHS repeat-associated protein
VRALTDASGALSGTNTYDTYGNRTHHTGTADSAIGYTGNLTDPTTGLLYLRARDYDPTTGQFLTVDPAIDATHNQYGYANGDPIRNIDPSGLDSCGDTSSISSFFGGLVDCASKVGDAGVSIAESVSGYDAIKSFVSCTDSDSIYNCAVMNFDPAYLALVGYGNEWRDVQNGCSTSTILKDAAQGVLGLTATAAVGFGGVEAIDSAGYFSGRESSVGDNFRISPFGNRNGGQWYERAPHYHRRVTNPDGTTVPGQGIKWHRPWQKW